MAWDMLNNKMSVVDSTSVAMDCAAKLAQSGRVGRTSG